MYKVIGSDGKTYGPVSAAVLREWLVAGRLDHRTPVLPDGATEWTYLGLLPEFARENNGTPPVISPPKSGRRTNAFATAGFVCGLISLTCCCGCPFNLLGLVFSIIALTQIGNQTIKDEGWGLALAGLICSAISLLVAFGFGIWRLALAPAHLGWHFGAI
jgi:Domain of unknown function (DUF4190)/GYF domain 2